MREVVTRLWCDRHLEGDTRVEGTTRQLGADNRWYEVELCNECSRELLGPLNAFLEEFGVRETSGIITPPVLPTATQVPDMPRARVTTPREEVMEGQLTLPTPPASSAKRYRSATCFIPGCGATMGADKMARHQQRVHQVDRSVLTSFCPICATEMDRSAMNFHVPNTHNMRIDQAYGHVLALGDEDGVVRGRLQLAGWSG